MSMSEEEVSVWSRELGDSLQTMGDTESTNVKHSGEEQSARGRKASGRCERSESGSKEVLWHRVWRATAWTLSGE